jgi:hypothetical protein
MSKINRLHQYNSPHDSNLPVRLGGWFPRISAGIVVIAGCIVLVGWYFNITVLKGSISGLVPMKANTALCLILSGLSLWLSSRNTRQGNYHTPHLKLVSQLTAIAVLFIGILTLCQYISGWNFGIDQLLIRHTGTESIYPGRMGFNTALCFILIGRALELLIKQKSGRSFWYAQLLALIAGVISLQALIGYTYKVRVFYGLAPYTTEMPLSTALTLIVLCVGILWARTDKAYMRVVMSNTYGGLLARRLLVAAIAIPLIGGWFIIQGQRAGEYDAAFGLALFAMIVTVIFVILIWQSAALIERLNSESDRAQQALRENEEKLRFFVDANVIGITFADSQGRIHQANDKFLQIVGYTREDLLAGRINWINMTPEEYLALDEQKALEAQTQGTSTPFEKEYIRKDGTRVSVLIGFALLGKGEEAVTFVLDLSDRKQVEQTLKQSEQKFRLAVENLPNVFTMYDAQGRFEYVNAATLRITSKSESDFIGRTDEEVYPKEVTQSYIGCLHKVMETRTRQTTEATINLPNFGKFTTQVTYIPLLDSKGEIYQIFGITDDITTRKQVEDTLVKQRKWLEEAVNLMPTPLLFIEPGTARIIFANQAAEQLAGGELPKAESISEYSTLYHLTDTTGNIVPPEQMPAVRLARGERIDGIELDWHIGERICSVLIYGDTLPAMHGNPAVCVLQFQDVSSLRKTKRALYLGYKRLQLLFETASDLLSSQEPISMVESLFDKLAEQIGLDIYYHYLIEEPEQMRLASYSGISEEVAREKEKVRFDELVCGKVASERHPIAIENVQQSTDPKAEFIRSLGITAYYAYPLLVQERLLGTISFGSLTRTYFSQNELGMMQAVCDQIAIALERSSLIASLQEQTEQLSEANRMKDEFLAVLSHELRSPLNAIVGWAQLLRKDKLTEAQRIKGIDTIERNAKSQTQLIEDLLDISRMIRGKLRLNVRNCDLIPLIDSALDSVQLAAEVKQIDVQFLVAGEEYSQFLTPKSPYMISGDSGRIQQIIWNLLSNAIKFTPQGGQVIVNLSTVTDNSSLYAEIQVIDTGIGISSEFLPHVFERFRQADSSSTRSYGGLGLGLAIVRHLVELHGGTVHADSGGKEKGSTFTVKLPLLKTQPEIKEVTPSVTALESLSGVQVLVVDDEPDIRDVLTTILESSLAEVRAVSSVDEALQTIAEWKPDVIVSDIGMPIKDGYALIRQIRALPPQEGGNIPAAALTAYVRSEDRMRAIKEGFQLHLPKPIEPDELVAVVASLAGRS